MVVPQAFTQPVYVTVTNAIGYAGLLGLASGGACWSRRMTLGRWIGSARSSRMVLSYRMDADIPTASARCSRRGEFGYGIPAHTSGERNTSWRTPRPPRCARLGAGLNRRHVLDR